MLIPLKNHNIDYRLSLAEKESNNDILEELSNDRSGLVREYVASNKYASQKILERLSSQSLSIRINVAQNKNTPMHVLERLINDENMFVRKFAKINYNRCLE